MPKRRDIKKILIIGSGPIQIGQACEFDYSGTQAVRALKAEGFEVILVNSNPATIMTDPGLADRTYIEPLIPEILEKIIDRERPDALLPTLGGQVALNLAMELHRTGVLDTYKVQVLGAKPKAIEIAEDREKFKRLMEELKLPVLKSFVVHELAEGLKAADSIGFPLVLRPSFTLGGTGGGIVYNKSELSDRLSEALRASPTSEVLIEECITGWKEIELEVMRDGADQFVVVCGIENMDPMGNHTGDSITVAPIQTLTDKEIQRLREAAKLIVRGVGVETGGCNIQFALDPRNDRFVVIEMNPRVSRSSALASKATGFPIAKIASLLAVGYTLDEIPNDITEKTPACFEPALDYVVVKVPRFAFEKFERTEPLLGTQMKSVGEVMAFGRTFKEALLKAFNALELGNHGLLLPKFVREKNLSLETIRPARFDRWWLVAELFRRGEVSIAQVVEATQADPWFVQEFYELIQMERALASAKTLSKLSPALLRSAKAMGYSDEVIAKLLATSREKVKELRHANEIHSTLNQIDTCAGEFEAVTPYYYFGYEARAGFDMSPRPLISNKKIERKSPGATSVLILGSGPNRIGQGVEFDYCCVKAAEAVKELGMDAVMLNCNPETVSTDYDTSSRLYFEPLTAESVERVLFEEASRGKVAGLLCQTGGQTALKLSQFQFKAPVLGTPKIEIDRAEDRQKFDRLLSKVKMKRPLSTTVSEISKVAVAAKKIGYPVLVRPSYVLGGRSMHIVRSPEQMASTLESLERAADIQFPLLVDRFLDNAIEIDVDCIGDGKEFFVLAVMEHIEEAGIHSGDSSCTLPAVTLPDTLISKIKKQSEILARELKVCGFLNIQFALHEGEIYVLEVNPRASRTLPFVCKATGFDWVKAAIHAMLGHSFKAQGLTPPSVYPRDFKHMSVKEVVFPFLKFPGVDVLLGPEMKSTGEVMGVGKDFNEAFVKGLLASSHKLPRTGNVFISVKDTDKEKVVPIARTFKDMQFRIVATHRTAQFLRDRGIVCSGINKVKEGQPHIVDAIINGQIQMVINTTDGEAAISDSYSIRRSALQTGVPYFTTLTAARAAAQSLGKWIRGEMEVMAIQAFSREYRKARCFSSAPASKKISA